MTYVSLVFYISRHDAVGTDSRRDFWLMVSHNSTDL